MLVLCVATVLVRTPVDDSAQRVDGSLSRRQSFVAEGMGFDKRLDDWSRT